MPRSRRFPVTITHLPSTRCQICDRTLAYRPGTISEALTEHYRRVYREALGAPAAQAVKAQRASQGFHRTSGSPERNLLRRRARKRSQGVVGALMAGARRAADLYGRAGQLG